MKNKKCESASEIQEVHDKRSCRFIAMKNKLAQYFGLTALAK
jgi:hypothetical protein